MTYIVTNDFPPAITDEQITDINSNNNLKQLKTNIYFQIKTKKNKY